MMSLTLTFASLPLDWLALASSYIDSIFDMLNIERVNQHWQRLHTECARYQQTAHSSLGCVLSCFWHPSSYTELHETLHLDGRSFRCDAVIFSSGNEPRTPQMMRLLGQRFPYMCALSIRINLYKNIDMHLSQVEGMLNSLCDAFTQLMTSLLHLRHLYIDQWSQYHLLTDELLCQSLSHFTTLESFYLDQTEAGLYCKYEIPTPIVSTLCQCPRLTIISGDLLVRRLSPNQWLTIFSTLDQIRCLTVRGRNGVMGSVMSVLHGSRAIALSLSHGSTNNPPPPPHLPDDRKAAFIRATSHIRALWYYSSARSSRGRLLEGMSITDIPLTQLRALETCQDTPAMKFCSTIHLLTQLRELTIRCDEMTGEEMIHAFSSLSHLHFLSLNRPPQCECVNEWMTLFNGLQHLRCLAFESECTLITSEMSSIVNSCLQLVELRLAGNFTAGLIENDIGANILSIIESHSTLQILTLDESFDKIIRKKVMMTNHGGKKEKELELELAPSTSFSRFQLMRRRSRAGLTWLDLLNSSVEHIATLLSLAESRVASTSWYSELFTSPNAHYANWYRMKRIEEYEQLDCTMKSSKDAYDKNISEKDQGGAQVTPPALRLVGIELNPGPSTTTVTSELTPASADSASSSTIPCSSYVSSSNPTLSTLSSPFSTIPIDWLVLTYAYLGSIHEIITVRRVCHHWRNIVATSASSSSTSSSTQTQTATAAGTISMLTDSRRYCIACSSISYSIYSFWGYEYSSSSSFYRTTGEWSARLHKNESEVEYSEGVVEQTSYDSSRDSCTPRVATPEYIVKLDQNAHERLNLFRKLNGLSTYFPSLTRIDLTIALEKDFDGDSSYKDSPNEIVLFEQLRLCVYRFFSSLTHLRHLNFNLQSRSFIFDDIQLATSMSHMIHLETFSYDHEAEVRCIPRENPTARFFVPMLCRCTQLRQIGGEAFIAFLKDEDWLQLFTADTKLRDAGLEQSVTFDDLSDLHGRLKLTKKRVKRVFNSIIVNNISVKSPRQPPQARLVGIELNPGPVSSFSTMPLDWLSLTCSYLNTLSDMIHVRQTNSHWCSLFAPSDSHRTRLAYSHVAYSLNVTWQEQLNQQPFYCATSLYADWINSEKGKENDDDILVVYDRGLLESISSHDSAPLPTKYRIRLNESAHERLQLFAKLNGLSVHFPALNSFSLEFDFRFKSYFADPQQQQQQMKLLFSLSKQVRNLLLPRFLSSLTHLRHLNLNLSGLGYYDNTLIDSISHLTSHLETIWYSSSDETTSLTAVYFLPFLLRCSQLRRIGGKSLIEKMSEEQWIKLFLANNKMLVDQAAGPDNAVDLTGIPNSQLLLAQVKRAFRVYQMQMTR